MAIARALAAKPAVILADEPTGEKALSYLQILNLKIQQAILIVTHDPAVAALTGQNLTLEDERVLSDVKRGGSHVVSNGPSGVENQPATKNAVLGVNVSLLITASLFTPFGSMQQTARNANEDWCGAFTDI